ncbi:unnamed protein product [Periconia digitata]|uniref:Nitronate monooxygenase domain-containing protein n=1 Tax=Periconia digitata TaxID=1303443 RepID=A0A9W4U684_9PLEO|nr:unnamed protein product [Periconia digitata]
MSDPQQSPSPITTNPPPLKSYLPWTKTPLIVNAPMAGFAGPSLATSVTLSGGLGMIGGVSSAPDIKSHLQQAAHILQTHQPSPLKSEQDPLPIGIGLLLFALDLSSILPVLAAAKPAVAWLFAAPELPAYAEWAAAIRAVSPATRIWIQVGDVASALTVARSASPDALCIQGADAGGHGYARGAGIISFVPEASDALGAAGKGGIPLLAAGGIVDGRGVAAALSLGAAGVVMGTRFLGSSEVAVHPAYRAAVLAARDGGKATVRSVVFDELRGPSVWPEGYDGRSLAVRSYVDFVEGVGIEEVRRLFGEAVEGEDKGFGVGLEGRAAIWAGTGVGLVNEVEGAGEILERIREEARGILGRLSAL